MSFNQKVYDVMVRIPKGKVTTYKVLGEKIGTKAYQAIGQACRNNPNAPEVPCHRVVASDGSIGGYSGETEGSKIWKKIRLLRSEGINVENGKIKDFEKKLWS